ncbi:MAG: hypothetical protein R8K22_03400 [Mariprofundaceae bacterium]
MAEFFTISPVNTAIIQSQRMPAVVIQPQATIQPPIIHTAIVDVLPIHELNPISSRNHSDRDPNRHHNKTERHIDRFV